MTIPSLVSYSLPHAADFPASKVTWGITPHRAVLLVHDMQAYFLRFYGEDSALVRQLQQRLHELIEWARAQGVPVVYTAQPAQQSPHDRALLNDLWGPGLTAADPALQAIAAELAPQPGDTVLTKWRYSAFQRSDLHALMGQWGRDQLIIGGVYAHIGCLMTAVDAFMRDIQPFMVGDAVADFSADEHQMALRYVAGRCGRVVSTAEVLASGSSALSWEAFKASVLMQLPEAPADLAGDDNLMDHGLDSIQVMSWVSLWNQQGLAVRFEDLALDPCLNGWWQVLSRCASARCTPQGQGAA